MRTTIVVDDELIQAAQEVTGLKARSAVVEEGLKLLVTDSWQTKALNPLWVAVERDGDIRLMRRDRLQSD